MWQFRGAGSAASSLLLLIIDAPLCTVPFCLAGWVRRHPASVQEDLGKGPKLQSACDNKALDSLTYKDLSKTQLGSLALTAVRW